MEHSNTLNTGDINLAASLMSMGIPLSAVEPCSLILRDNGSNYARFHILSQSVDGAFQTERLMQFWKAPDDCREANFISVMAFVKEGIRNKVVRSDDWFDFAISYLEDMGENVDHLPAKMALIPDYIKQFPDSATAHTLAFAYNRDDCWQCVQKARRRIMITRGESTAAIDTNLPTWKRNELLARLEG
jgi:hypothetical protein